MASAKNPRKWGRLFDFRSVFIDPSQLIESIPPVQITFPDGTHILSDQDGIDYTLSNVLGQEVRLMRAQLDKPRYEQSLLYSSLSNEFTPHTASSDCSPAVGKVIC